MQLELDRLLSLVRRELGAKHADIVEDKPDTSCAAEDELELRCRLPDGRSVVARFDVPPSDRDTKLRRLEMLAGSFDTLLDEPTPSPPSPPSPPDRPSLAQALRTQLEALRDRAAAVNAVVIDANSPVVWGAAAPNGLNMQSTSPADWPSEAQGASSKAPHTPHLVAYAPVLAVSRAAIDTVRGLSELAATRKGKHIRRIERAGDVPFLAHSFAGIYLLLLVYDAPFDELRAERAIVDLLPRIERLVLALPPLDPSPVAGARAMARPRRR